MTPVVLTDWQQQKSFLFPSFLAKNKKSRKRGVTRSGLLYILGCDVPCHHAIPSSTFNQIESWI
jgi:hypothetical protein